MDAFFLNEGGGGPQTSPKHRNGVASLCARMVNEASPSLKTQRNQASPYKMYSGGRISARYVGTPSVTAVFRKALLLPSAVF